ncbi:biotin carboxylase N-terminal domain-containing protein, partial [Staphylococcus capitis]|uniref:ATP-binding protein n=1 Tax=Staphylococcus capitis TaxID=29388 RepID=UPI0030C39990
ILSIATSTGCDGVHPGYGFLAENGDFAEMIKANVPVVPGSEGLIQSIDDAKKIAKKIGYPVIIKATAGGGGKGIRVARDEKELETGYRMT